MKKYNVCVGTQETWYHYYEVEAKNEEEAQKMVEKGDGDIAYSRHWETHFREVQDVFEIEETSKKG